MLCVCINVILTLWDFTIVMLFEVYTLILVDLFTEKKKLFHAPETATSTEEALQQRLEKYKSSQKEAQQQGNGSKARRMGRIVKVISSIRNMCQLLSVN